MYRVGKGLGMQALACHYRFHDGPENLYRTNCRSPAMRDVPPMTAGKLISTWPAEPLPVGLELLEADALVPAPPGLATLPWQT